MDIEKSGQSDFDAEAIVKEVYGSIPSRVKISDGEIRFRYLNEFDLTILLIFVFIPIIPAIIDLAKGVGLFSMFFAIFILILATLYGFYGKYIFTIFKANIVLSSDGIAFEKNGKIEIRNKWIEINRITIENFGVSPMQIELGNGTKVKLPNYILLISPGNSIANEQLYTLISRSSGGLVPVIKVLPKNSKLQKFALFSGILGILMLSGTVLTIINGRKLQVPVSTILAMICLIGFFVCISVFAININKLFANRKVTSPELQVQTVGNTTLRADWKIHDLEHPTQRSTYVYTDKAKHSFEFKDLRLSFSPTIMIALYLGTPLIMNLLERKGVIPVGMSSTVGNLIIAFALIPLLFFYATYFITYFALKKNIRSKLIFDVDGVYVERNGIVEAILPGSLEFRDSTSDPTMSGFKTILKVKVGKEKLLFDTLQMVSISNQELLNNLPDELTKL